MGAAAQRRTSTCPGSHSKSKDEEVKGLPAWGSARDPDQRWAQTPPEAQPTSLSSWISMLPWAGNLCLLKETRYSSPVGEQGTQHLRASLIRALAIPWAPAGGTASSPRLWINGTRNLHPPQGREASRGRPPHALSLGLGRLSCFSPPETRATAEMSSADFRFQLWTQMWAEHPSGNWSPVLSSLKTCA